MAAQGVFTTTGYVGTTVSGRAAALLTGVTGQRVYSIQDVVTSYQLVTQTVQFTGLLSVNGGRLQNASTFINQASAGYAGIHGGTAASGYYANNVYLRQRAGPGLDSYGAQIATSVGVEDELASSSSFSRAITSATVVRLLVANIGVEEQAIDWSSGVTDVNYDASFLVAQNAVTSPSVLAPQCSPTQPNLQTYSFCYYVDNSNLALTSANRGVVSAYGTFTATGPVARDGRQALLVQSINGVRQVLKLTNNVNTTTTQGIVALKYTGADRFLNVSGIAGGGWNKNYVFTSGSPLDYNGVLFTLTSNVVFPSGTSVTSTDVDIWWITPQYAPDPTLRYTENPADESESIDTYPSSNALFQYSPFNANNAAAASFAACSNANSLVTPPASITTYSFCFYRTSTSGNFLAWTTGVISAYTTAVTLNGRSGYPISNITGVRSFASANGFASVSPLVGAAGGWQGAAEGYSAQYLGAVDQLLYSTSPYIDNRGVLVNFAGIGDSANGAIFNANVVRYYYDPTTAAYVDQSLYNITYSPQAGVQYLAYNLTNGVFNLVADGGVSAASGVVGQQACGQPVTNIFNFCYQLSNSVGGTTWSIITSGTLTINTAYTQGVNAASGTTSGYQVVGATGTRVVTLGGTTWSQKIVGVAPVQSYLGNDNVLTLGTPVFDPSSSTAHSLSLQLDGAARTVQGTANGAAYINLNNVTFPRSTGAGFTEAGLPINDGVSSQILSSFDLRLQSNTIAYSCPQPKATVTTSSSPSSGGGSSSSLSGGAIAGIVIGVVVGVLLLLVLAALLRRSVGSNEKRHTTEEEKEGKIRNSAPSMELTEESRVDHE